MKNIMNPVCSYVYKYSAWFGVSWDTGLYFSVMCWRLRSIMLYAAHTITLGALLTKHSVVWTVTKCVDQALVWAIANEWRDWLDLEVLQKWLVNQDRRHVQ